MNILLCAYLKQHPAIFLYVLTSIIYMLTIMIPPILSSALINNLTGTVHLRDAYTLVAYIFLVSIFTQIFYYLKDYHKLLLSYRLQETLERDILVSLYKTSYLKLINEDNVYLSQRIHSDTAFISDFVFTHLANVITNLLMLLLATTILFQIHPLYAFLSIGSVPIYLLLLYKMKDTVYTAQMLGKESDAKLKSTFHEQMNMIPTVKLNAMGKESLSIFHQSFEIFIQAAKRIFNYMYLFYSVDGYLTAIIQIIFFLYGIAFISEGKMNIGQFTIVLSYYSLTMGAVKYFLDLSREYFNFRSSKDFLDTILNYEKEKQGDLMITDLHHIELHAFHFQYDSSQEIHYKPCTFDNAGLILIKGANGSGKSTLLKFLSTLYQVEPSPFFINQIPIHKFNVEELRRSLISYVEQESTLWDLSLQDTVLLYFQNLHTYAQFEEQIGNNQLHDFYNSSNLFHASDWEKKVSSFSTGQIKKLIIVLELLKQKKILLLDEPTAALDVISCKELVNYLNQYKQQHLIIIVSHDHVFDDIRDFVIEI